MRPKRSDNGTHRREKSLASHERAGAWSRRKARERQYRFAKQHWRALLALAGLGVAVSPAALFMPEEAGWFYLGVLTATFVAIGLYFVVMLSGSAALLMGDQGEQWTHQELDVLRRKGWRVIHRVLFRQAEDIDHIAIGRAGVVVIETKWSSSDWRSSRQQYWIHEAVRQVPQNARLVRLVLRSHIGDVPIWPVVVLWPSDERFEQRDIDGVTVLPGLELGSWMEALPVGVLDEAGVEKAWTPISEHVVRRDAADLARYGPPPKSVWEHVMDAVQLLLGFLTGFVLPAFPLGWFDLPGFFAGAVAGVALAALAMRVGAVHRFFAGVFVGSGVAATFMLIAVLLDLLLA